MGIINIHRAGTTSFGQSTLPHILDSLIYLTGNTISDIILFDDSTEQDIYNGNIVLPRHNYIFVGVKDGVIQFKPYEYDPYRIVVTTYKDVIVSVDSVG